MSWESFASLSGQHVNEMHWDWAAIGGTERRPYFATGDEDTGDLTVISQSTEYQFLNFTDLNDTPVLICKVETGGFKVYGSATVTLTCAGTQNQNVVQSLNSTTGFTTQLSTIDARGQVGTPNNIPVVLS